MGLADSVACFGLCFNQRVRKTLPAYVSPDMFKLENKVKTRKKYLFAESEVKDSCVRKTNPSSSLRVSTEDSSMQSLDYT